MSCSGPSSLIRSTLIPSHHSQLDWWSQISVISVTGGSSHGAERLNERESISVSVSLKRPT